MKEIYIPASPPPAVGQKCSFVSLQIFKAKKLLIRTLEVILETHLKHMNGDMFGHLTFNIYAGIRIFEDISITNPKVGKVILLKSVGVVEIQEGFCFLSTMVSWTRWSI
ncbi:hypothetical protein ZEAMMB73_Zm00001d032168 [Zea mays]|uniref:Uncharacterized protein n=1 Tax=Zea mays TaxID=4577 RepID=A0A1D6KNX5_MAIZE|nr:hypothetical protein ZEAMMB73_Zm00001d032168 [Zea mays]